MKKTATMAEKKVSVSGVLVMAKEYAARKSFLSYKKNDYG
jgi:hypothetical protein